MDEQDLQDKNFNGGRSVNGRYCTIGTGDLHLLAGRGARLMRLVLEY